MSKRDIVLLAVIVNAAVLSLLFVLASTSENLSAPFPSAPLEPVAEIRHVERRSPSAVLQEEEVVVASEKSKESNTSGLDEVIQDFVASMQSEPGSSSSPAKPRVQTVQEPKDSFANTPIVEVIVEPGDVLGKIAARYQTTVLAIKKVNNLQSDFLRVGQVLKVPVGTKEEKSASVNPSSSNAAGEEYYTIESGDNPWKIAKKFHISVFELLRLNGLDENKAKNLRPGEKIRVR